MKDFAPPPPTTDLRPPAQVMRLSRLGAMFPTRLSFLRVLIRQLAAERARVTRPVWEIDAHGHGHAVYALRLGGRDYALVAVSTPLPDHLRTDRVIAEAWDTAYVLHDGVPTAQDLARIVATAPRQEAARFTERDLVLSRANRSVRLFDHVIAALRGGRQPDPAMIDAVGYLMRTTAVYGNGKFGIADHARLSDRSGLSGAFAAEMLAIWLIRGFTHDLVEHLGGAPLPRALKRQLGIGNATGLGMAPFLVSHPVLLHNWMVARETALARVRAVTRPEPERLARLRALGERAARHLRGWTVSDPEAQARIDTLRREWEVVQRWLRVMRRDDPLPLDRIMRHVEDLSEDTQELTVALLLEPFGDLVDGLAACMNDPLGPCTRPFNDIADLRAAIDTAFDWAQGIDFDAPEATRLFWYVSEAKAEPRLGDRLTDPGAALESPLDIARRVRRLADALPPGGDLRAFRAAHPEHELAIARVAIAAHYPYAEIRDNLIGQDCRPVDMLRAKLALFGATRFDPRSDRWTRIALAQGAPLADELDGAGADDWWMADRDA